MMTPEMDPLQSLRDRICFMLSNRLTYPKSLLSMAQDRPLTEEEIRKAAECFEACLKLTEAELVLFKVRHEHRFTS